MKSSYTDDYYSKLAQRKGLRARSYFKLEEIDKKYQLIKKDSILLDVGASPGSWLQYCLEKTKKKATLYAIDIQELAPLPKVTFLQKSILDLKKEDFNVEFEGIISDMAPKTTGMKDVDASASFELVSHLLTLTKTFLKKGGFLVCKYFEGEEKEELRKEIKSQFDFVKFYTPSATRKQSRECFIIAKDKKLIL